jgi:multidrug efflux pump subunit AcrA (membrane-fusion protein)
MNLLERVFAIWPGGRRRAADVALLVCMLFLAGCSSPGQAPPTPTPWPTPIVSEKATYTVQRGSVIQRFLLSGQVVPVVWDSLYFTVDGKLASLKVTDGTEVKQNDIVAELDTKALNDQLAQAQISLDQAQDLYDQQASSQQYDLERAQDNLRLQQITLQRLQRSAQESTPVQKDKAQKELDRARVSLQKAQSDYDKVALRPDVGATPQAMALQQATIDYQIAEDTLKLQILSDIDLQIAAQEVQVHLAQLALQRVQTQTDSSLQRNLDKAKLQVDALQRQIDDRRLRAPYAGRIVAVGLNPPSFQRGVSPRPKAGDNIVAFVPLIILAKPGELEVNVPAEREHATELTVGQAITITHSAVSNQPFVGRVIAVPVQTLSTGEKPAQPQTVRIALPQNAPPMSIGDYVGIEVVNKVHADTLFLPPAAVRTFMGRSFIVVREGGKERSVDVTTGLSNDLQVEVLSGLREGDTVVGP